MTVKKKRKPGIALGLAVERGRIEGVVVRRSGANLQVLRSFQAPLTLDPLTNDPELVGREIRNHLNAAGIREKRCVVALPLNWVLTLQARLPEIPEEDMAAFLDVQAERGFPHAAEDLMVSRSRFQSTKKEQYATLLAVPRNQVVRLDTVLRAAQLRPLSFTLGASALDSAANSRATGIAALVVGENNVDLQITCGGGVAALRCLEGTSEMVEGQKRIHADLIARELKITLGQLPNGLRDTIRTIRVFGHGEPPARLARDLRPRADAMGLQIELVTAYGSEDLGAKISPDAKVSPALSVAARFLADAESGFEFIPPKVSSWPQLTSRFGSGRLALAAAAAAVVVLGLLLAFIVQGVRLSRLESQWAAISPRADRLTKLQGKIRDFRPWQDEAARSLVIMRKVTDLFPETGSVSVRSIEIKDRTEVTCVGVSKNATALSSVRKKMAEAPEVADFQAEMRGNNFTFNFQWKENVREK